MGHTGGRRSFWGSYRGCLTEFSEKTFVHGCQRTVEKGRSNGERMLWTLLIMSAIVATIWLLASSYVTFLKAPTATGRSVYRVPISTIPFPAVALCSGTRISREALTNYRDYIFSKQNQTTVKISETRDGVYEHLLQLGSFYTLNVDQDDFYLYNRLHSFFIEFYGNPYPLGEIIANLTPPCDDFLKECYWNGVKMDCSTIFNTNWTDYGPCCTFNYQRLTGVEMERISKQGLDIPSPKPLYVKESEFKEGLTVIIEQNSSDQNYNVHSSMASRVLIFNPQDYPDMGSNAYIERQIQLSGEVFIELFPESFKGSQTMRHVSAKARGCYFWDENTLIYKGFYTFSECQLACKLNDMIRFCGCYPYQYANIYNQSRCLLSDISCLIKWKSMWDNSEPYMVNLNSHFIGTQCSGCRPQCNYIKYGIRSHFGFVQPFTPADFFNESISMDESHLSVVHVHFALPYAVEYLQTIVSTWYDLLATLGGLAGFIIGASLLSVVEFAWYASGKLCTVWFEKSPEEKLKALPQIYLSDFKIVERRNFPMEDALKKK